MGFAGFVGREPALELDQRPGEAGATGGHPATLPVMATGDNRIGTYVDFVERLPAYLGDVTRDMEARISQAERTEATARQVGRQLSARARSARSHRSDPG
jgi:hypothetical protein